ncbi:MAG: 4Fe-4S dicluster domain-containing protein [Anaerolineae bacterium]|jgi:ferredoxin-type protein NapH|nr:4Fe-4S dicluster domain-containing protein [Anaerolineae bacterium]MBT7325589.1 4Fe-4S dicluster domain-containing protein [Anaerolineae bacterium]
MKNIQEMIFVKKLKKLDKKQRLRYGLMVGGILAFAPPVGFIAQLFGSATICGNLCPRMAIGTAFTRELFMRTAGVALLFIWLGITFFYGRWMCSHICPAGNLTEFGSKLIPKRFKIDYCKILDAPLFRYGFLGAYVLLPVVGVSSICCSFCSFSVIPETFGALFTPRLADMLMSGTRLFSVLLFVFVLGIFARDGRGHCHLVCPVGALDSIVNVLGAKLPFTLRERVNQADCSGCGFCATNCPASAIQVDKTAVKKVNIDQRRCYQCRSCESDCPKNAIYYGKLSKQKESWHDKEAEQILVLD